MREFRDKVAVITGAGSGIGRALALELAKRGAQLALSDVDKAAAARTASECDSPKTKVAAYELDVADRAAVYAHAHDVRTRFGTANLVVNNAGVALSATIEKMSWDDFTWLMDIDFWGVAHGTKAFLPDLIASGDGHLVNISSVFGLVGVPTQGAYNAAKFAVRGFTEALRQEMKIARHPVGVTCVHPGGIRTNIAVNAVRSGRGGIVTPTRSEAGLEKLTARAFRLMTMTTPPGAARAILRGVERDRPRVLIGPDARVFDAVPRLIGPRYQDLNAPVARLALQAAERFGLRLAD